jgi:hypothetical protein
MSGWGSTEGWGWREGVEENEGEAQIDEGGEVARVREAKVFKRMELQALFTWKTVPSSTEYVSV